MSFTEAVLTPAGEQNFILSVALPRDIAQRIIETHNCPFVPGMQPANAPEIPPVWIDRGDGSYALPMAALDAHQVVQIANVAVVHRLAAIHGSERDRVNFAISVADTIWQQVFDRVRAMQARHLDAIQQQINNGDVKPAFEAPQQWTPDSDDAGGEVNG